MVTFRLAIEANGVDVKQALNQAVQFVQFVQLQVGNLKENKPVGGRQSPPQGCPGVFGLSVS